ncbi:MAG TPA: hypothetical protein VL400_19440 [Polyangiaceae bacterium]|nr:hypothetical protein [Polyangiaceae bacterium]
MSDGDLSNQPGTAPADAPDLDGGSEAPRSPTLHWRRRGMVGWYDPRQLLRTGLRIAATDLFAKNADSRLLQPLFDPTPRTVDLGKDRDETTVDYISDTGDGFDSTYAVAYWATEPSLALVGESGSKTVLVDGEPRALGDERTAPGEVLVLGGDEVYPTGSEDEYRSRLEVPFELASAEMTGERRLLAIPGNHDWYENLVAFHQLFMRGKRFGAWRTAQRRSYFAARLPHDWWLLGTDMQLMSDLDPAQLDFFESLDLGEGANVILCHAEPHWVYDAEAARKAPALAARPTRVARLERWLGPRLRMVIAGDLHHYRRHVVGSNPKRPVRHLVTAGGGGAFLHPTHGWRDVDSKGVGTTAGGERMQLVASYPSKATSRWLTLWCLAFPWTNRWFMIASGAVYGLVSLTFLLGARGVTHGRARLAEHLSWTVALTPSVLVWLAVMLAGFVASTDTSARWYRWVAGLAHGASHTVAAVLIPLFAVRWLGGAFANHLGVQAATFVGATLVGALVGAVFMGSYLFGSLTIFGRHRNETFSAIREKGYKNFLRMKVDRDGVDVVAFGIRAVPKWDVAETADGQVPRERVRPTRAIAPGEPAHPFVIERFRVEPRAR